MIFDTKIGQCAIVWSAQGLTHVHLPEESIGALKRHMEGHRVVMTTDGEPPWVAQALNEFRNLLEKGKACFDAIPLDMETIPPFHKKVYTEAMRLKPGQVASYGEIASRCGKKGAARAVGQAMAHNPLPLIVPCHRVIAAGGKAGGFSSFGGTKTKFRLLEIEGYTPGEIKGPSGGLPDPSA
jgi:methylated-DNA-[protein]-cysteine S-methyltransferase